MFKIKIVGEVMNANPVAILEDSFANHTLELMFELQVDLIIIVKLNKRGIYQPIGLITRQDLVKIQDLDLKIIEVTTVMRKCKYFAKKQDLLSTVQKRMNELEIEDLPVISNNGTLIGVISYSDLS